MARIAGTRMSGAGARRLALAGAAATVLFLPSAMTFCQHRAKRARSGTREGWRQLLPQAIADR